MCELIRHFPQLSVHREFGQLRVQKLRGLIGQHDDVLHHLVRSEQCMGGDGHRNDERRQQNERGKDLKFHISLLPLAGRESIHRK